MFNLQLFYIYNKGIGKILHLVRKKIEAYNSKSLFNKNVNGKPPFTFLFDAKVGI